MTFIFFFRRFFQYPRNLLRILHHCCILLFFLADSEILKANTLWLKKCKPKNIKKTHNRNY